LRSAALATKELALSAASRLEHCLDKANHSAIRYLVGYQREEFLVIHGPEKVSETWRWGSATSTSRAFFVRVAAHDASERRFLKRWATTCDSFEDASASHL
jgi:hypothetical protein